VGAPRFLEAALAALGGEDEVWEEPFAPERVPAIFLLEKRLSMTVICINYDFDVKTIVKCVLMDVEVWNCWTSNQKCRSAGKELELGKGALH
jgi:hypothetical protein